jgi:hypothetical protein
MKPTSRKTSMVKYAPQVCSVCSVMANLLKSSFWTLTSISAISFFLQTSENLPAFRTERSRSLRMFPPVHFRTKQGIAKDPGDNKIAFLSSQQSIKSPDLIKTYGQVPFQAVSTIFPVSFNAEETFFALKIFFGVGSGFFFAFFTGGSSTDFIGDFSGTLLPT